MNIRPAVPEDMADLVRMGRAFHAQSSMSRVAEFDETSFATTLAALLLGDVAGAVLVAERDGKLTGMTACLLFPMYFNFACPAAQELFWWVEPEHRTGTGVALIDALETAAREAGAKAFLSASIAGLRDEAIARLYARRGYALTENTYIKALQ